MNFIYHFCLCTPHSAERLKSSSEGVPLNKIDSEDLDLPLFKLITVADATNNFSDDNKLGEGGFGPVYKVIILLPTMCIYLKKYVCYIVTIC